MIPEQPKTVVMYAAVEESLGGISTYIRTIVSSDLRARYAFGVLYQNCAPGGMNLRLLWKMMRALRARAPDIVHVHGLGSTGFYGVLAARLAGCKYVVTTIHGHAGDSSSCSKWKGAMYRHLVEPVTIRLSHKVYCVCQASFRRDIVRRNAGKRGAGYIYNPAPTFSVSRTRQQVRAQHGFTDEDVVFMITGRVVIDKGYQLLEEAVRILNARGSGPFKLLVVGDGHYRRAFEEKMKAEIDRGQIVMVGRTNQVAEYLSASDVFVFPSLHEHLPFSLLEAGQAGLPCIASNVGGIPEIVRHGVTGFLMEAYSPEAYAARMGSLIHDRELLRSMSQRIASDIPERFSLKVFCEALESMYEGGPRASV